MKNPNSKSKNCLNFQFQHAWLLALRYVIFSQSIVVNCLIEKIHELKLHTDQTLGGAKKVVGEENGVKIQKLLWLGFLKMYCPFPPRVKHLKLKK